MTAVSVTALFRLSSCPHLFKAYAAALLNYFINLLEFLRFMNYFFLADHLIPELMKVLLVLLLDHHLPESASPRPLEHPRYLGLVTLHLFVLLARWLATNTLLCHLFVEISKLADQLPRWAIVLVHDPPPRLSEWELCIILRLLFLLV